MLEPTKEEPAHADVGASPTVESSPASPAATTAATAATAEQEGTTMITITDVIKYQVRQQATAIWSIKKTAADEAAKTKTVWVDPAGKVTPRTTHPGVPGWSQRTITTPGAISPKHKSWASYQQARARVNRLLTARAILKAADGEEPAMEVFYAARKAGKLSHHVRHGQSPQGATMAALRTLHKLGNRLRNHPERFADVETWVQEREAREAQVGN